MIFLGFSLIGHFLDYTIHFYQVKHTQGIVSLSYDQATHTLGTFCLGVHLACYSNLVIFFTYLLLRVLHHNLPSYFF